jgi:hypothetical protein
VAGVAVLFAAAVAAASIQGQDKPKRVPVAQHPKVDQFRIDDAIERGCKWLLSKGDEITKEWPAGHKRHQAEPVISYLELVVLTLAHSGFYEEDHPEMKRLLDEMIKREITTTYRASIQAMALQKINPKKYQWRIAQCAQFLIDNICENGQWDYGEKTKTDQFKPPKEDPPTIATETRGSGGLDPDRPKPWRERYKAGETVTLPKVPVVPQREPKKGPPNGDNSNSQYAAIGLRACLDAGIVIPAETLRRARDWWVKSQNKDGGWGYNNLGVHDEATGPDTTVSNDSYGSMTVGAVGALCIYDKFLGSDWRSDATVTRGMDWIARNYDVRHNPKKKWVYMYYLYGLERAGILYGTETFGKNEWYPDGATHLLDSQKSEGKWDMPESGLPPITDTCFAVLFLRRGTAPLVTPKIKTGTLEPKK